MYVVVYFMEHLCIDERLCGSRVRLAQFFSSGYCNVSESPMMHTPAILTAVKEEAIKSNGEY